MHRSVEGGDGGGEGEVKSAHEGTVNSCDDFYHTFTSTTSRVAFTCQLCAYKLTYKHIYLYIHIYAYIFTNAARERCHVHMHKYSYGRIQLSSTCILAYM